MTKNGFLSSQHLFAGTAMSVLIVADPRAECRVSHVALQDHFRCER